MTIAIPKADWSLARFAFRRLFRRRAPEPSAPVPVLSPRERAEILRDCGMPAEDVFAPAPEAALPFFLREGFGERSR